MTDHARTCNICGEKFGHAWGGVGLTAHKWLVHGLAGQTTFNGKTISYGPEGKKIDDEGVTFDKAMAAPTIEDGLAVLKSKTHSLEQWEDLAWSFAFNNGNSRVPPSEKEEALANFCMDKIDELEQ